MSTLKFLLLELLIIHNKTSSPKDFEFTRFNCTLQTSDTSSEAFGTPSSNDRSR